MKGRTPAGLGARILARLLTVGFFLSLITSFGCGGSLGVEDGSIVGKVFGNASGGSATPTPLAGVTIVAQRNGAEPPVIRSTVSDDRGEFVFTNMPTGEYSIGYSIRGFQVVDTSQGATNSRTALGDQVRVFVEPGGTALAPDITLKKLPDEGDGTVIITLVDPVTGTPVTNATVTVGAATTSNGGANGVYTLSVPVRIASGGDAGTGLTPTPQNILVSADGYGGAPFPATVVPIANETVSVTVQIDVLVGRITGFVQIAQYQTLYNRNQISVTVDNIPLRVSGGDSETALVVDTNGFFTVRVPASNSVLTRQFNLNFTAPNLQTAVVSNVVAPRPSGTRQLTSPVVMQPVTVDLVGTVVDSSGNAPNQLNPQGIPDTVIVQETGQVGNIINGAYTIPDVPATDQNVGPTDLNLSASGYNPNVPNNGGFGAQETIQQSVKPVSDGTANPTFTVPLLVLGASAS
jgi:hypothetical protein